MSEPHRSKITFVLVGLLVLCIAGGGYAVFQIITLQKQLATKIDEQTNTATELTAVFGTLQKAQDEISHLSLQLEQTIEALEETKEDLDREERKNDDFQEQIRKLAGTVGDLDKLSKTDEELLQKYSKVYFLNENYIPSDIKQINKKFILEGRDVQFFHGEALPFLIDMIEEAEDDDIDLKVVSAYRSFDHQSQLKGDYTTVYGSGANAFSADQGYSEHQLGTTVDLTDPATAGTYTSFAQTEAYQWLLENAHKFGFTLSYPENNTFYVFEPWHWRFVGTELARDLYRANAHFYDWEQRKIDAYLLNIFD